MCHMSSVTCHTSRVTCQVILFVIYFLLDKAVELVSRGSVMNMDYPVYLQKKEKKIIFYLNNFGT